MKTINLETYKSVTESMRHHQFHIDELKPTFPDLMVDRQASGGMAFLSADVNPIADCIEFKTAGASYTTITHYAHPYKDMETACPICREKYSLVKIRVNSIPDRVPLLMVQDGDEPFCYGTSFEDTFKQYKFSKQVIGKSRLYVIEHLKTRSESPKTKFDEVFIPASVKKLLTFS